MQKRYSLQKRLIIYISLFSLVLGCILIFAAYRIALEEINEVLDKQMQSQPLSALRKKGNHPRPLQSQIDLEKQYHEEDLFVDVWAYANTATPLHPQNVLVAPVKKAGLYKHQTPYGTWLTYIIPVTNCRFRSVSSKMSGRNWPAICFCHMCFSCLLPCSV